MSKKNEVKKSVEKSFYKVLIWVTAGIVVCFSASVIFFIGSQIHMVQYFDKISDLAVEQNEKTSAESGKNTSSESKSSALVNNENNVSVEYNLSDESDDNVLVRYLEKLLTIQKETSSTEIISLIYSVIITILSIIGTGLIAKVFKNSEEVKENAEEAKKNAEEAKENADYAEKSYVMSIIRYENMLEVNKIHDDILYIRNALSIHNKIEASDRFNTMNKDIFNFIEKFNKKYSDDKENETVERLYEELNLLADCIFEFENFAKKEFTGKPILKSYLAAAKNYNDWLDEAISHCEEILK